MESYVKSRKNLRANVNKHQTKSGKSPELFSLILSYFVAQYVLIIVVQIFCENIFSFSRNNFFSSTAQICKFYRECYFFKTPKDIDDLTICPTHRSNLGVGWSRGSNSRCRVPKEVFGHGEGRVKSIPKGDRGIGKRVSRIILQVSGKFLQPGSGKYATYHRVQNYASRQT